MSYQICSRCVMDSSDIEITFDGQGNCNHCNEFFEKRIFYKYQGEKTDIEFLKLIEKIKKAGKGKEYDCIIGISGGVDSSYAVLIAKKVGLRVLGVHMDNGWNSEEAVLNIKSIADKLKIDYESFVLDWNEIKDLQLSFLKASVPEAETPTDMAIAGSLHRIASKYGVKYIISGGNFVTEGILPRTWHYNSKDMKYLNFIHRNFGKVKLKKFPTFGFLRESYYKLFKGIKMVYLLNYIDYSKDNSMEILKEDLDWRNYGGKHYESKYTGFIQSYYLFKKFGIDYRRATFSSQICTGDIAREDAIMQLKNLPFKDEKVIEEKKYIAKKLGISVEEFEEIINLPPKWYFNYPNNQKLLKFIYNLYRKLFNKEKLASF